MYAVRTKPTKIEKVLDFLCRGSKTTNKDPLVELRFQIPSGRNIRIESLSLRTLTEAIELVNRVFPAIERSEERAGLSFRASFLANSDYTWKRLLLKPFLKITGVNEVKYWVAVDESTEKIVGTTGLYSYRKDGSEANWIGWMCVDPNERNVGIGRKLVEFAIERTRKDKRYLRVYTSTDPTEAAAQALYESLGLVIMRREPIPGTQQELLYRELLLDRRTGNSL